MTALRRHEKKETVDKNNRTKKEETTLFMQPSRNPKDKGTVKR